MKHEGIIANLIHARVMAKHSKNEMQVKFYEGMVFGLENALKELDMNEKDIENAIIEFDLKRDC